MFRMDLSSRLIILLLFLSGLSHAQQDSVIVNAPDYEGQRIFVWKTLDAITGEKEMIAEGRVEDSVYVFPLSVNEISFLNIGLNFQIGGFYCKPGNSYKVRFPKHDGERLRTLSWSARAPIIIESGDPEQLNIKIASIDDDQKDFFAELMRESEADSSDNVPFSARQVLALYKENCKQLELDSSDYIKNYQLSSMALTQYQLGAKKTDLITEFMDSIMHSTNDLAYADLFNALYLNYFDFYTYYPFKSKMDSSLSSPDPYAALYSIAAGDEGLKNEARREAVLIKGIHDLYTRRTINDSLAMDILNMASKRDQFESSGKMARFYLKEMNRSGGYFPNFTCYSRLDTAELYAYLKEGLNYIHVYGSWSSSSKAEMDLMKTIKKEYSAQVNLISISIDEDYEDFTNFLANNKGYHWSQLWIGMHPEIFENLELSDVPRFYLIDGEGKIIDWMAKWPSRGIEEVFYKMEAEDRKKNKESLFGQPNKSTKER